MEQVKQDVFAGPWTLPIVRHEGTMYFADLRLKQAYSRQNRQVWLSHFSNLMPAIIASRSSGATLVYCLERAAALAAALCATCLTICLFIVFITDHPNSVRSFDLYIFRKFSLLSLKQSILSGAMISTLE